MPESRRFFAVGLSFGHQWKEVPECPKGGVVVRHGVCPMLSVVAMGMLLIGRRADRRHGSRGATPTIARRPRPVSPFATLGEPTAIPSAAVLSRPPSNHPLSSRRNPRRTMQFACMCNPRRYCTRRAYTRTRIRVIHAHRPVERALAYPFSHLHARARVYPTVRSVTPHLITRAPPVVQGGLPLIGLSGNAASDETS